MPIKQTDKRRKIGLAQPTDSYSEVEIELSIHLLNKNLSLISSEIKPSKELLVKLELLMGSINRLLHKQKYPGAPKKSVAKKKMLK